MFHMTEQTNAITGSSDKVETKTAYLSGAMEYAPDRGEKWRKSISIRLKQELGHEVFNPNEESNIILSSEEKSNFKSWKESDIEKFKLLIHKIIDHDLGFLTKKTDYVVCYWDEYASLGGGTQGEITVAYQNKIPVFLLTKMPVTRISSWILGCSEKIFFDENSLISELKNQYK